MAVVGITHNPVIRAHYERKRAAGKSKMNALGHCMSKALNLVWGVWRYSPASRFRLKRVPSQSPYAGLMKWHHYGRDKCLVRPA